MQGVGKTYNELKEGEPAIERLFSLTRFRSKVIHALNLSVTRAAFCEHLF